MSRRYFTLAEANALVPRLEEGFRRMMQLRVELRQAYLVLERAGHAPTWESLRRPSDVPAELRSPHARFVALAMALAEEFQELLRTGVEIKDPEIGLCDFPALRDDRIVLFCWKLGEPQIAFWHELEAGYAGRQPLVAPASPVVAVG